jgi:hypothetical protein
VCAGEVDSHSKQQKDNFVRSARGSGFYRDKVTFWISKRVDTISFTKLRILLQLRTSYIRTHCRLVVAGRSVGASREIEGLYREPGRRTRLGSDLRIRCVKPSGA